MKNKKLLLLLIPFTLLVSCNKEDETSTENTSIDFSSFSSESTSLSSYEESSSSFINNDKDYDLNLISSVRTQLDFLSNGCSSFELSQQPSFYLDEQNISLNISQKTNKYTNFLDSNYLLKLNSIGTSITQIGIHSQKGYATNQSTQEQKIFDAFVFDSQEMTEYNSVIYTPVIDSLVESQFSIGFSNVYAKLFLTLIEAYLNIDNIQNYELNTNFGDIKNELLNDGIHELKIKFKYLTTINEEEKTLDITTHDRIKVESSKITNSISNYTVKINNEVFFTTNNSGKYEYDFIEDYEGEKIDLSTLKEIGDLESLLKDIIEGNEE